MSAASRSNWRCSGLNDFSRIAICGLIASYEGAPTALPDMRIFLIKRFRIEGFIVSDHPDLWPQAIGELTSLAAAKKLTWRETIREGLADAPRGPRRSVGRARTSARCWSRSIEVVRGANYPEPLTLLACIHRSSQLKRDLVRLKRILRL